MPYALAILPVCLVLVLMIRFRFGAPRAGALGLVAGIVVARLAFGLTTEVLWVSQGKGLLLSLFVLAVMWPALLLYHWIDQNGGIQASAALLHRFVLEKSMCLLLLAWAVSGALEGIAGFGLPIAVVAPMLVALEIPPLRAVAAVAIGHSWAVTFGDMGVILQTLSAVVSIPVSELVPCSAVLLGICCLVCGLGAAWILGLLRQWQKIVVLSAVMALVQFGLATAGLVALSAFGAGLAGLISYSAASRLYRGGMTKQERQLEPASKGRPAWMALGCYGGLFAIMAFLSTDSALRRFFTGIEWKHVFPAVETLAGFRTEAAPGQVFRPVLHPGSLILLVTLISMAVAAFSGGGTVRMKAAGVATYRSGLLPSLGILIMVGLATLMDHCGMSFLLAKGAATFLGGAFPLVSPLIGVLGAFATGSNNNSNVLFGSLQKNASVLLGLRPELLSASQTAGGSLGSMLAPAKITVGCSTVKEVGREGQVLRRTVPFGIAAALLIGLVTWLLPLLMKAR